MTESDPRLPGPAARTGREEARRRPDSGRRGRLRTVLPLLIAAWLVLEVWVALELASLLGGFTVVALLVATAVLGGWIVKRAGLRALRAAARAVEQGREPEAGESHTAITLTGGVLLIVPGFLSDLLGLACLFPPTRALLRRVPARLARSAVRRGRVGDPLGEALRLQEQLRIHRPDGKVVPGEVVDSAGPTGPAGPAGPAGPTGPAEPQDGSRPPRVIRVLPPDRPRP
ncbi:FxsA family membrane protein [Peterkaempfera bronchialis]|uniref:FxsA family membrane protein n=1 Tax=Peterkaempfera bronchialis TaxID=2126346 RepID=UPI001E35D560|nr:FxsA family membrane protein [Peterkaempfera bronchialis]